VVIIKSIKPVELQIQFLKKQVCECYKLHGLESPIERECRGFFIKSHYRQEYCIWEMQEQGIYEQFRMIRAKKRIK